MREGRDREGRTGGSFACAAAGMPDAWHPNGLTNFETAAWEHERHGWIMQRPVTSAPAPAPVLAQARLRCACWASEGLQHP